MLQHTSSRKSSKSKMGLATIAVLMCSYAAAAQTATPPAPQAPPPTATPDKPQAPMTKDQAKELFRSVDEILSFASTDTKLPIEHTVKRKLISRDEVNHYLREKFDEAEGAKRMERSEIVLKKLGLFILSF